MGIVADPFEHFMTSKIKFRSHVYNSVVLLKTPTADGFVTTTNNSAIFIVNVNFEASLRVLFRLPTLRL